MSVRISVTGIVEIDAILKGLPNQINHRIMGSAHLEAAKPLIDVASNIVRVKTGNLKQSIGGIKLSQRKTNEIGMVHVGPRRKKGRYLGNHGHLLEYGHVIKRGGQTYGRVKPYPFMRPAFEQTKNQVETNIVQSVQKKLMNFMRRTIKNTGGNWIK